MRKKLISKLIMILFLVNFTTIICLAQTTTTIEHSVAIMNRVNEVVCTLLTVLWYIAAAIAALMIIMAGIKYMSSDTPEEVEKSKSKIGYVVVGLILVLIACPLVSYLVDNTDIMPFDQACQCPGMPAPTTTTTTLVDCVAVFAASSCPDADVKCPDAQFFGTCFPGPIPDTDVNSVCDSDHYRQCCCDVYTSCCSPIPI